MIFHPQCLHENCVRLGFVIYSVRALEPDSNHNNVGIPGGTGVLLYCTPISPPHLVYRYNILAVAISTPYTRTGILTANPQIMDKAHPSPPESTPETSAEPSFSTFDRALEEYLSGLPKDKKQFKFIELCRDSGTNVTPEAINKLLQHEQAQRALSGPVQRIFRRVMSALKDYSEVINQLGVYDPFSHPL